ncbi:hypothetical protein BHAOGJBA_6298 [Methylobacterium hispanicum]|jgi:hypothetical protein|uniref:Sulfotransferase domain-containing protein n=1 Tax=Methylobacterium hispanicum TaxID=270350 RepID=A0AAV4ZZC5_9HYPH|nr:MULTISPECIES: sulfotransferase domain-containing protein [Methylobacterium]GJD92741.1 hypothetical protein BHAOGJBA_6298 [Methylobacterium hispanicum]
MKAGMMARREYEVVMTGTPPVGFLIGGVQKGGTTALFEYLRRHAELQMADCKEVHFFDRDADIDWENPDYNIYHASFEEGNGRLRGEATPIYIYWPDSITRIYNYNPDMKMIFLFRDPVERAYSHWAMETRRRYDDRPFSWAIREGRTRVDDPIIRGHHRVYSYVERGFYANQLERVYNVFPERQVLNISSSDLSNFSDQVLRRVCDFLEISHFPENQKALRANVGSETTLLAPLSDADRLYLRSLYAADQLRFTELTGLRLVGEGK